jgi:hypothetical protein
VSTPQPYWTDGQVPRSALAERNAAKTYCPKGHPYDEANTYVRAGDGARVCKTCKRERYRRNPRPSQKKAIPVTLPTGDYRIDAKIRIDSSCWTWTGFLGPGGYGMVKRGGRTQRVHRYVYELLTGITIPAELVIDHLCRNRACCNPAHLEPVTTRENILRGVGAGAVNAQKTHCPSGHPYDGTNLAVRAGGRWCRECERVSGRAKYRRKREHKRVT